MDKRKTERLLREKLEQIPVPDLPCPNPKAADTDTFLAPVPRPQRGFWRLPITAAVAAALLLCTTAALLQVSWPNLLAGPSPSLSPSVLPADSVSGTPVTKLPSSSPTVLLKERLARHLAAVIPDVRPDQITVSDKGQSLLGHFVSTDALQLAYLCTYYSSDKTIQHFLVIERTGGVIIQAFAYGAGFSIRSVWLGDVTGDGLDDLIITVDSGANASGEYFGVFSMHGGSPQLLMTNWFYEKDGVANAPESYDFGFYAELLPDYRAVLRNRYTSMQVPVVLDKSLPGAFDQTGRGQGDVEHDYVESYEVKDVNGDGRADIRCRMLAWYSVHAASIGWFDAWLTYNPSKSGFGQRKSLRLGRRLFLCHFFFR